ncbi:hypothetical protein VTL71DRAFT_14220 [Oculimacula yallundae]|uniref:Cell wall protein PhiA n=1 Tax=Oculimacula yallundae TaxID=86028 RepID=A0ABR4CJX7_9HELO
MQYSTLTALTTFASLVSSSPTPQLPVAENPAHFSLLAIRSGSPIHYATFSAANSSMIANLPLGTQNAVCKTTDTAPNTATFHLNNGALELYGGSAIPQTFYVDRSWMGQGKLGYTTGAQPAPKNAETQGWVFKDGYLYFGESGLIACPNAVGGGWSVWVNVNIENPAGNKDCTPFAPKLVEVKEPLGCKYSE